MVSAHGRRKCRPMDRLGAGKDDYVLRDKTKPYTEFAPPLSEAKITSPVAASFIKQTVTIKSDSPAQKLKKINQRQAIHIADLKLQNKKQQQRITDLESTVAMNEKDLLALHKICKDLHRSNASRKKAATMHARALADFATKGLDKDDKVGMVQQTRSDIVNCIVKDIMVSSHGSLMSGAFSAFYFAC